MKKSNSILFLIIAVPFLILQRAFEALGPKSFLVGLIGAVSLFIVCAQIRAWKWKKFLMQKYRDVDLVEKIIASSFWQGQTAEQLLDSLGEPTDIDKKILKTKKKEIWKYNRKSAHRYGLKIILENDFVIGWEKRQ